MVDITKKSKEESTKVRDQHFVMRFILSSLDHKFILSHLGNAPLGQCLYYDIQLVILHCSENGCSGVGRIPSWHEVRSACKSIGVST